MRFRLVASDLDGTLLRSDEEISPRTQAAIHSALGRAPFVIATGRPPRWVHGVADQLGHRALCVCSNGALTVDLSEGERIVDSRLLSAVDALAAVEAIRSVLPDAAFAVDQLHGFAHDPAYVPKWALPPDVRVAPIRTLLDGPSLKVLFRHPDLTQELLQQITDKVGDTASVTYGATGRAAVPLSDTLIEVMAPGVNKASALERIVDRLAISAEDVLAFGDMPNDFEMIEWAGHGVAMANGHTELKRIANEVTLSNNEDGVARILEREMLASA